MLQWERTYACPKCGNEMDRDVNSAVNIEREGLQSLVKVPAERREVKLVETTTSSTDVASLHQLKVESVKQETAMPLD